MPGHHAQESPSRTLSRPQTHAKSATHHNPRIKPRQIRKFSRLLAFFSGLPAPHPTRSRLPTEKSPRLVSALGAAVAAMLREWHVAVMNGGQSGHDHLITAHGKYFDFEARQSELPHQEVMIPKGRRDRVPIVVVTAIRESSAGIPR